MGGFVEQAPQNGPRGSQPITHGARKNDSFHWWCARAAVSGGTQEPAPQRRQRGVGQRCGLFIRRTCGGAQPMRRRQAVMAEPPTAAARTPPELSHRRCGGAAAVPRAPSPASWQSAVESHALPVRLASPAVGPPHGDGGAACTVVAPGTLLLLWVRSSAQLLAAAYLGANDGRVAVGAAGAGCAARPHAHGSVVHVRPARQPAVEAGQDCRGHCFWRGCETSEQSVL